MNNQSQQIKVSKSRWQDAQDWERQFWINTEKARNRFGKGMLWNVLAKLNIVSQYRGDDWNDWWKDKFDNYNFLPDRVEDAIELGCGPYSNMRKILECCVSDHVILSDPLIKTYVTFRNSFVARMYRERFMSMDDHPIEACPFAEEYFGLVVMINVLDHVQDALLCVETAMKITKTGGILILGQDLSNEEDTLAMRDAEGEIGHPIKLHHESLDRSVLRRFDPILHRILPRQLGRAPAHHYGTYIFAGKKLP